MDVENLSGPALLPGDAPPDLPQKPVLLFVGNVWHGRQEVVDVDLLLELARAEPRCSLVLLGSIPAASTVARRLSAAPNVFLLGPRSRQELAAYLRAADVCLIPYRRSPLTRGISPLKMNEYLAAGRPVVSTDFSSSLRAFGHRHGGSFGPVCGGSTRIARGSFQGCPRGCTQTRGLRQGQQLASPRRDGRSFDGAKDVKTRSVLILLENLSLPADRRAWRQATTLAEHGWRVTAVCPQGRDHDTAVRETIDGVDVWRYPLPVTQPGLAGYILEYSAMMVHSLRLTCRVFRGSRFAVIQGGNPPDLFFLIALLFRPFGVRYVYDERDANPELFEVKFGRSGVLRRILYRLVLLMERPSLQTADEVIVPNQSFRRIAVGRGHVPPGKVTVVRSGPLLDELVLDDCPDADSDGFEHCIGYLGVMGSQDGVDVLLDAVAGIVARRGRTYVRLNLFGDGEQLESLRAQATRLGLDGVAFFHGFLAKQDFVPGLDSLSSALYRTCRIASTTSSR